MYHYRVSEKLRIGELLLLREKIDPWVLSHTLKEQGTTGQRLISVLVRIGESMQLFGLQLHRG